MTRRLDRFRRRRSARSRYGRTVAQPAKGLRVTPHSRPAALDAYEGLWVAVLDDEVVAAEETSHKLALKLDGMDHRKRNRVVVEFVRPSANSYIVGVG